MVCQVGDGQEVGHRRLPMANEVCWEGDLKTNGTWDLGKRAGVGRKGLRLK